MQNSSLDIALGMTIHQLFGPDSDSFKNPSKKGGFQILIPDSSNILKGVFKKLSATYVLKINVLSVLYDSLPRIEPDFKRFYI